MDETSAPSLYKVMKLRATRQAAIEDYLSLGRRIDDLTLKCLAFDLLERWPSASYLALDEGDQSDTDVVVAGLFDEQGTELGLDDSEDDEVQDYVIWLNSYRLNERIDCVESTGRRSQTWRLNLAKAAAIEVPGV